MNNIKESVKELITVDRPEGFIVTGYDNLEVLKLLPDNCVDQIYSDIPYLTNKTWEKNGWSFEDKFDSMWAFLFEIGERLVEAKRIMRTRHYQLVDGELMEDGQLCTYQPRKDKILADHSSKAKLKKLEGGIEVGASIFIHIDYRTNSELKTYLMDVLFGEGEGSLTLEDLNALMTAKIGKQLHVPISIPKVNINQGPDIVCDMYAGSLSYCAAAHKLGRRYIGIELNSTEQLFLDMIEGVEFGQERKD